MARRATRTAAALMLLAVMSLVLWAAQGLAARVRVNAARVANPVRDDEDDFRRRVLAAQVARALARGQERRGNLPADKLAPVGAGHKLRKDAAERFRLLLKQAESDLRRQQEAGDPKALKVSDIGVYSAYRSVEEDEAAWHNSFGKHFRETREARAALRGGAYGDEAVEMMVGIMRKFKAAPGFSYHTSGTAVDFTTTEGGLCLTANSSRNVRWRKTWLYNWLVNNAARFEFNPLSTEAWHWEYGKRHERRAGI
ncbi:MAG: D-alanyl-D-alanine carboxypeptidase family protein [Acidobacteria bacterium]|nr:D-alanyl-D-alanine carboxypeptidase family protein [Acidobacteriota bacterium]